ncbi:hypothetical protein MNV49_004498 [Pseudohyphozyma bogoriensis]|nr:hypothetical protein MNV49_004498 [Pseudohyphozyma bogoriensis]
MATIQSCPPEIVLKVLELTVEEYDFEYGPGCDRERRRQLRSTTLVARDWTKLSQMLLWRNMVFLKGSRIDKFTQTTSPGRYRTVKLHLYGIRSWTNTLKLLNHLRGLVHLILEETTIPTSAFQLPALEDLHTLHLDQVENDAADTMTGVKIKLQSLILEFRARSFSCPSSMLVELYDSCGTLEHLSLTVDNGFPEVLEALLSSSVQIRTMSATWYDGPTHLLDLLIRLVTETKVLHRGALKVDVAGRRKEDPEATELESVCRKKGVAFKWVGIDG